MKNPRGGENREARVCKITLTPEEQEVESTLRKKGYHGATGLGWGSRKQMADALKLRGSDVEFRPIE